MKRKFDLKHYERGQEDWRFILTVAMFERGQTDEKKKQMRKSGNPEFHALVDSVTQEELDEFEAHCKRLEEQSEERERERVAALTPHQRKHEDLSHEFHKLPEEELQELRLRFDEEDDDYWWCCRGEISQRIISGLEMEGVEKLFEGLPRLLDWAKRSWEHSHKH